MSSGEGILHWSTTRSGDWIDRMAAQATAFPDTVVQVEKEGSKFSVGIEVASNPILSALSLFYVRLLDYRVQHMLNNILRASNLPKFTNPLPVVVSGGTSRADGFIEQFQHEATLKWKNFISTESKTNHVFRELLNKITKKQKWILKYWKKKLVDSLFIVRQGPAPANLATDGLSLDTTLSVTPKDFDSNDRNYDGLTMGELTNHIAKMKFRGSTGVEIFEVEKQIRYASPFTVFVLVFMGVIVSSKKSRGGTGFQIALGFMLSFIFILFFTMTRTYAETGSLSPFLAAWLPNSVFAVISLAMYKYVPR
jgi:lipopolysaccharide export LptBFGC system permease protein LptF